MIGLSRAVAIGLVLLVAVCVQAVFLHPVTVLGVVPNLVLLFTIAAGYVRGPHFAAIIGLSAGLLLDVSPPSGHLAGRWALALVIAGVLAAWLGRDTRGFVVRSVVIVAVCSVAATSVYLISGALAGDAAMASASAPAIVAVGAGFDVLAGLLVVPLSSGLLRRIGVVA